MKKDFYSEIFSKMSDTALFIYRLNARDSKDRAYLDRCALWKCYLINEYGIFSMEI